MLVIVSSYLLISTMQITCNIYKLSCIFQQTLTSLYSIENIPDFIFCRFVFNSNYFFVGISYIVYIGEGQVRIFGMFYVEWIDLHDTTPLMTSWVGFVFSLPNIFICKCILSRVINFISHNEIMMFKRSHTVSKTLR